MATLFALDAPVRIPQLVMARLDWRDQTSLHACGCVETSLWYRTRCLEDVETIAQARWELTNGEMTSYRRVRNDFGVYRGFLNNYAKAMSSGWRRQRSSRFKCEDDDPSSYDFEGKPDAVVHELVTFPGHPFAYPFPVHEPFAMPLSEDLRFLKALVQSCNLQRHTSRVEPGYQTMQVNLKNDKGDWVGVLDTNFCDADEYEKGLSCELIALSRCVVEGELPFNQRREVLPLFEIGYTTCLLALAKYEFYDVMWIERVDGIAYRKAIGLGTCLGEAKVDRDNCALRMKLSTWIANSKGASIHSLFNYNNVSSWLICTVCCVDSITIRQSP